MTPDSPPSTFSQPGCPVCTPHEVKIAASCEDSTHMDLYLDATQLGEIAVRDSIAPEHRRGDNELSVTQGLAGQATVCMDCALVLANCIHAWCKFSTVRRENSYRVPKPNADGMRIAPNPRTTAPNPCTAAIITKGVQLMLDDDNNEERPGPWGSAATIVPRKDGQPRILRLLRKLHLRSNAQQNKRVHHHDPRQKLASGSAMRGKHVARVCRRC